MNVITHSSLLNFKLGNDGLTVEFYKAFWPLLGNLVEDCLNEAYECAEPSTSQKMAIMKLIEKKGKDKNVYQKLDVNLSS